jgi:hypothetical protein
MRVLPLMVHSNLVTSINIGDPTKNLFVIALESIKKKIVVFDFFLL